MSLRRDESAVSAVIATILIGAMTVALAALVVVWVHPEKKVAGSLDPRAAPAHAGGYADFGTDYRLTQTGPDPILLAHSSLVIVTDNVTHSVPMSALAAQLPAGATQWAAGQSVCIAGASVGCLYPAAQTVSVAVITDGQQVFKLPALPASPLGAIP